MKKNEKTKLTMRLMALLCRKFSKSRIPKEVMGKCMDLKTSIGNVAVMTYNFESKDVLPFLVHFHASGFVMNSVLIDDPYMHFLAQESHIKIINVDYSLAPEHPFPKALEEGSAVITYLLEHHNEFGLDVDNLFLGGESAGGNIATVLTHYGIKEKAFLCRSLLLCFPLLDLKKNPKLKPRKKGAMPIFMMRFFNRAYCSKEQWSEKYISPIFLNEKEVGKFPSTILIAAENDSLELENSLFYQKLKEANVDVQYHVFPKALHMFTHDNPTIGKNAWNLILQFILLNIKKEKMVQKRKIKRKKEQ